ncbi:MAG TPA: DUF2291 family protein [Candidatus Pullichristensenella stercoripullorum]|nr:DUF2291 family protein [Candidatus Pullichristensenella stercoripullorum]
MSKLKDHLPALVAAVVIVVLIACTCRVTYIPDPVQETTIDETGAVVVVEELSVAEQYCQDNWDSLMMPTIQERAQDIATMLPMIREDLAAAGDQYASRENETSPYSFCLSGTVQVLEIEEPDRATRTRLVIDVQPYDGEPDAKIQVSSVIRTNALRDAVGFLKLDDFANQVEFADLTTAFNARVQETVIAGLDIASLEGQEVDFLGCVAINEYTEPDDFLIVPVELGPKAGE